MVSLRELLGPRRRRKAPRADAPRTIVPEVPRAAAEGSPAARLDAARERLRREIPPQADDPS